MAEEVRMALSRMSASDRHDELEDLVVGQFRRMLLMVDGEELRLDLSYFDLGLTSLRLTEIKQRLEGVLDIGIDATVMFNQPTVEDLVTYLDRLFSLQTKPEHDRSDKPISG